MKSFGKRLAAAFCLLGMMATQDIGAKNVVITEYGAIADSTTLNTVAIQQAIDACAESGGGTVTVPTGIFMTGAINLRSNVELYLERGATLRGSLRIPEDYPHRALIYAEGIESCAPVPAPSSSEPPHTAGSRMSPSMTYACTTPSARP